jgi:hypothetical protein
MRHRIPKNRVLKRKLCQFFNPISRLWSVCDVRTNRVVERCERRKRGVAVIPAPANEKELT